MNVLLCESVSNVVLRAFAVLSCSAIPMLVVMHYSKPGNICVSALEVMETQQSLQSLYKRILNK